MGSGNSRREKWLERGPFPGSWQRTVPPEELFFDEAKHRQTLESIVRKQGSQSFANFVNRLYELKTKITLD